ncbi:MAG: EH signature domain-containing protein [Anaerolineaceae bacterium]|jgi:hypothetical protein|nr:EH signature domain-containing protein [Anaerolineaceae bacterium]
MRNDFNLADLTRPHLSEALLKDPLTKIREIAQRNLQRLRNCYETKPFKNRKEELIKRLQRRRLSNESFDQATDVFGRERLLLSLYQEYFDREDAKSWLPPFDIDIACSLLGNNGSNWHAGRRRQITLLFFTHFDSLAGLSFVCDRLLEAYDFSNPGRTDRAWTWEAQRKVIFNVNGPETIAKQARVEENFPQLMERFEIPNRGRFAEKLRQVMLLNAIKIVPIGEVSKEFKEIEILKGERVTGDQLMGAAALKIIVQRVAGEGGRKWTGMWPPWITRFGCDPRYGRATIESNKWWAWATDSELRLAQQGVTGLTLKFFINFLKTSLEGTGKSAQFSLRARFLMALFEAGKIQNARLVLHPSPYRQFPPEHRDPFNVARLSGAPDQTSMVCLQCVDDIYIIEGTHTFGLRMFYKRFPIDKFWDQPKKTYHDSELRVSPSNCPIFIRHTQSGSWVSKFFQRIRTTFHVEWNEMRMRLP